MIAPIMHRLDYYAINRTLVELKQDLTPFLSVLRITINRTLVELKLQIDINSCSKLSAINRTLVELKHVFLLLKYYSLHYQSYLSGIKTKRHQEYFLIQHTINRTLVELKCYWIGRFVR